MPPLSEDSGKVTSPPGSLLSTEGRRDPDEIVPSEQSRSEPPVEPGGSPGHFGTGALLCGASEAVHSTSGDSDWMTACDIVGVELRKSPGYRLQAALDQGCGLGVPIDKDTLFRALSRLRDPRARGPAWARPMSTAGGAVTGAHRPAVPVRLFRAGEVLPILAGPGLLDVRERPGVRGGLRGPRGLHRPQVLHPGGKCFGDRLLEGRSGERGVQSGRSSSCVTRTALPAPTPAPWRLLLSGDRGRGLLDGDGAECTEDEGQVHERPQAPLGAPGSQ